MFARENHCAPLEGSRQQGGDKPLPAHFPCRGDACKSLFTCPQISPEVVLTQTHAGGSGPVGESTEHAQPPHPLGCIAPILHCKFFFKYPKKIFLQYHGIHNFWGLITCYWAHKGCAEETLKLRIWDLILTPSTQTEAIPQKCVQSGQNG